ncbi:hypothetical protein [Polyangium sp. y55x31]|uniref:hypothetical protein n=1 Tax=Polyangium sp. y55x31 TaxID=3042688 RepID=UPI002482A23C|nr:hypothetical protein [Polyangium sp. y55x31]MDI1479785.1 hypothetical protein [Polyangium sp. y55x31]
MTNTIRAAHRDPRRSALTSAVALAFVLLSGKAAADPPDPMEERAARRAAAETLFDEGKWLMDEGRYPEACPKFAESQRLDAGVGTLLNLADCLEKIGRTASAWAEFRAAAYAAREKGQVEREQVARERAAALEPRLARLVITAPWADTVQTLEIRKDGQILGRALWGTAVPVDPGKHVVEAQAEGKRPYRVEVEVPGEATRVTAAIPELMDVPKAPAPPPPVKPLPNSGGSVHKIAGIALGGAGVVSVIAGSILGMQAIARNDASAAHCIEGNLCDATGVALRSEARMRGDAATGTIIAGVLAATGGLVLYLTAPEGTPARAGVGTVGSGAGLVVGGVF